MKTFEKTWINESGDILVRVTPQNGPGIVEIMQLWDSTNNSGCVIAAWYKRKSDNHDIAELSSIHDRLITTKYDDPRILVEALAFGQRLADMIIETEAE